MLLARWLPFLDLQQLPRPSSRSLFSSSRPFEVRCGLTRACCMIFRSTTARQMQRTITRRTEQTCMAFYEPNRSTPSQTLFASFCPRWRLSEGRICRNIQRTLPRMPPQLVLNRYASIRFRTTTNQDPFATPSRQEILSTRRCNWDDERQSTALW